jgi:hypothetical protein
MAGCQGVSAAKAPDAVGTISLLNTSVDFGNVAPGGSKTVTVTATNSGTATVTVGSVTFSTKYFSMTSPNLPASIAAGQSATMSVVFSPNAAGTFAATMTIASDASDAQATVSLSGTGSTAPAGALTASPTSMNFGNIQVGQNPSAAETVTNTGNASITISAIAVSGTGFTVTGMTTPATLAAGQSGTFIVHFIPTSAGAVSGNVTVTSTATNPTLTIPLSGAGVTAGGLGSNPTSLAFGSVQVGSNKSLSETVTNTGGSSVTISAVAASGTGFSLSGITTPVTLTAGQAATFSVKFTPASAAAASGNVTVTSNASNPTLTIPLTGTGTAVASGQLAVSPTTLAIGSVVAGTSGTGTGSLTASGASVTVTAVSSNNAAFSVSGLSLPVTIPAGQSASITVTFSPQSAGAASATLTFTSNASPATTQEGVTGTGTAAPVHTVALSWNASSSTDVAGYNIYRAPFGSACGAYVQINSSLNVSMAYTDSSVTDGASYCYAATAVDTSNSESTYSNIVSNIQIPVP